jgi:hypothetical protein
MALRCVLLVASFLGFGGSLAMLSAQDTAKPAEAQAAETKPAEVKPAEAKPEDKPAETKPAEAKPADAKPEETPAEPKPPMRPRLPRARCRGIRRMEKSSTKDRGKRLT